MTVYTQNFEGTAGVTEGTTVTAVSGGNTNSAGQSFLSSVAITGAGTCVFSAAGKAHGAFGMRAAGVSGDTVKVYWTVSSTGLLSFRIYFTLNASPASTQELVWLSDTAASAIFKVGIDGTRHIYLTIAGTTVKTYTTALTVGASYRMEGQFQIGGSASTGSAAFQLFTGDTTTQVDTAYSNSGGAAMGSVNFGRLQWGKCTSASTLDATFDDVVATTTATAVGTFSTAANVGPTATIMTRQAPQAQGTVVVSGTVSDSDGTVKSAAVQVVSGPNSPTVSNSTTNLNTSSTNVVGSFTGIPGRYVVRIVGTDNADVAVTSPPTQIVDVYPATDQDVVPYSEVSGTYTRYGTAGDDMTAVTDTDVTTGLQSGLAPSAEKERFQWCAFGPGDVKFFLTHDQTPASPPITVQFTVFKEDGVTQVYQTSVTAPVVNGTETPIVVDAAGLALIPNLADRRALITELSATQ